jgi:hypothetical protein
MQSQVEKEKGALFGETQTKMITTTVKEMTPLGVKLEINQQGQFAGAKYTARELSTNNVFVKMDGTMEWEIKIVHTTPEGDILVGSGRGTGKTTAPGNVSAEGQGLLMTQSLRLSAINNTRLRIEAIADLVTGEVHTKSYTM